MNRNETIRQEILTQLYGYRPSARDAERMAKLARREGELSDATTAEFEREAAYLAGLKPEGLILLEPDPLAPGHKRWAITSAGIAHLEARGLV